jgi:DNA-binding Xre family transcriptional regulator
MHSHGMQTKLAQRMKLLNINDAQLAEQIGKDRSIVSRMRNGKLTPSLKTALLICEALAMKPEDLLHKGERQ